MKIIKIVLPISILVLAFFLYKSIATPIAFEKRNKVVKAAVIQKLKDIRALQMAYRSVNDNYVSTFDSLIHFAKNDSIPIVTKTGDPEDSTSIIVIDTSYIAVMDTAFHASYSLDSIMYVPYGKGAKFTMEAGSINKGGVRVPVFEVRDPKPFDPRKPLKVGSMTDGSTAGNWEN